MTFDEKIESLCKKYGVNYFAYSRNDLAIFTTDEIKTMVDNGLVYDEELHFRKMVTTWE